MDEEGLGPVTELNSDDFSIRKEGLREMPFLSFWLLGQLYEANWASTVLLSFGDTGILLTK